MQAFIESLIKNFSTITRPLSHLLTQDTQFECTQACQIAFEILKEMLIIAPIMQHPDWLLSFEIMCGVSNHAIRSVLR